MKFRFLRNSQFAIYIFLTVGTSLIFAEFVFAREEAMAPETHTGFAGGAERCTTHDNSEWVREIGWNLEGGYDGILCPGWGDALGDTLSMVFEQCVSKFFVDKSKFLAVPYSQLVNGKPTSLNDYLLAIGQWGPDVFVSGIKEGVIAEAKSHAQKCMIRSFARLIPGPPGMKQTAANLGEAAAEAFDIGKFYGGDGKKKLNDKLQKLSEMGGAVGAAGRTAAYTKTYKQFIDRSNKFYQAAESIDWFKDLKNTYDDHWFQRALKECRTSEASSRLGPIRDSYTALIRDARNDMIFIEREVYCIEDYARTASTLGWAVDGIARSLTPFGNVHEKKTYYQWVNGRQCDIAKELTALEQIASREIPLKDKEREKLFFDFEKLKAKYVALRRDCVKSPEERKRKEQEEKRYLAEMQKLAELPCGHDLDVAALERVTTPQDKDWTKYSDLKNNFREGVAFCNLAKAKSAFRGLQEMGQTTDFHCQVEDQLQLSDAEVQIAKLEADHKEIDRIVAGVINQDGIVAMIHDGCGFDRAQAALDASLAEWGGVSLNFQQCKDLGKYKSIKGKIRIANRFLEAERAHVAEREGMYLSQVRFLSGEAEKHLTAAKAGGADRCAQLEKAIYNGELAGKAIVTHRYLVWCPEKPGGDEFKARAEAIIAEAKGLQGDTSAITAIVDQARQLVLQACNFAAADQKLAELADIKATVCVQGGESEIAAVRAERDKIVQEFETTKQNAQGVYAKLQEGITACNAEMIRSTIKGIGTHHCITKLADPELKKIIDEIHAWSSAPDVIAENVQTVRSQVAKAQGFIESCEPAEGDAALASAESALSVLRGVHPNCDAVVPEQQRIPQLRAELKAKEIELAKLSGELSARLVTLQADLDLTERNITVAGRGVGTALRQKIVTDIVRLKATAAKLQSDTVSPGCDAKAIAIANRLMARINGLTIPEAQPQVVAEETEPESDTEELPPRVVDREPPPDDDLDDFLDDISNESIDAFGEDANRARDRGTAIGSRVSSAGSRAAGDASDWGNELPPPMDPIDHQGNVNRGRRQAGQADAFDPDGRVATPPTWEPDPPYENDPWDEDNSVGSSSPGVDTSNPGERNVPPTQTGSTDHCQRITQQCLQAAEQNKQMAIAKMRQAGQGQTWDADDEAAIEEMRKRCRVACNAGMRTYGGY